MNYLYSSSFILGSNSFSALLKSREYAVMETLGNTGKSRVKFCKDSLRRKKEAREEKDKSKT